MIPRDRCRGGLALPRPTRSWSGPPGAKDGARPGRQGYRAQVENIVWRGKRRCRRRAAFKMQTLPQVAGTILKRCDLSGDAGKAFCPRGGWATLVFTEPSKRAAYGP